MNCKACSSVCAGCSCGAYAPSICVHALKQCPHFVLKGNGTCRASVNEVEVAVSFYAPTNNPVFYTCSSVVPLPCPFLLCIHSIMTPPCRAINGALAMRLIMICLNARFSCSECISWARAR